MAEWPRWRWLLLTPALVGADRYEDMVQVGGRRGSSRKKALV
jgi:hypothetical protein